MTKFSVQAGFASDVGFRHQYLKPVRFLGLAVILMTTTQVYGQDIPTISSEGFCTHIESADMHLTPFPASDETNEPWGSGVDFGHEEDMSGSYREFETEKTHTNDILQDGEFLHALGSAWHLYNRMTISGALTSSNQIEFDNKTVEIKDGDYGSIALAIPLVFDKPFQRISGQARIGDGPHGSSGTQKGDKDFYKVSLKANESINVAIASLDSPALGPKLVIFNAVGVPVFVGFAPGVEPFSTTFSAPVSGDYYLAIYDLLTIANLGPQNLSPFESELPVPALGSEGQYTIQVDYLGASDTDFYSFDLDKGDIFAMAVDSNSAVKAALFNPSGEVVNVDEGVEAFLPKDTLIPTANDTVFSYVASESGTFSLALTGGVGPYKAELLASRSGTEIDKNDGATQIIYLNFSGGNISLGEFRGLNKPSLGVPTEILEKQRTLSPLSDFVKAWSIDDSAELASLITDVVLENVQWDFWRSGINPNFNVEIISDYGVPEIARHITDHLKRVRVPYSEVIVGGTSEEFGIPGVGFATVIDKGNFSLADRAVVLLDTLANTDPQEWRSINQIPLAEGVDKAQVVATIIGNIVSHEIGHLLGAEHTDGENDTYNLMDINVKYRIVGIDIDKGGKFGDENTVDVDFVTDTVDGAATFTSPSDVIVAYALSSMPYSYFWSLDYFENEVYWDDVFTGSEASDNSDPYGNYFSNNDSSDNYSSGSNLDTSYPDNIYHGH